MQALGRNISIKCVWIALAAIAFATPVLADTAYIANTNDAEVAVLDLATDSIVQTIPDLGAVRRIAISKDGKFVHAPNFDVAGAVSVIDTRSNSVTAVVPVGSRPFDVEFLPDGTKSYVVNQYLSGDNFGSVSVIDTSTNTVVDTIRVGNFPRGIAVTPDGQKVYVVNALSRSVSVIDTNSDTVVRTLPLSSFYSNGSDVATSPDGSTAYVTFRNANRVVVLDTATDAFSDFVLVDGGPWAAKVSPDGNFLYTANILGEAVSVVSTSSNSVVATIPVGLFPRGLAFSADGAFLYVTNGGSGSVSIIDTQTNSVIREVPVGNSPNGIIIAAVVDSDDDEVSDDDDLCAETAAGDPVDASGCSDAQVDGDGDGYCNVDAASAGPSICLGTDNCPTVPNPGQIDDNNDGYGDACVPLGSLPPGADIGVNPVIGEGTTIAGGTSIGDNANIGDNVTISKDSDIGDDVTVGGGSEIAKDGVIGNGVTIGEDVFIAKNSEIGDDVQIGDGVIINKDVAIGAGAIIGDNVTIEKGATILPGAVVPDGTVVSKNSTFGPVNVLVNYDEQQDGDIQGEYGLGPVFELGVGVNTVTGIGNGPIADPIGALFDFDIFSIVIPSGRSLTSITLDNWGTPTTTPLFMRIRPCAQPVGCSIQWSVVGSQATPASIAADVAAISLNLAEYTFNNSGGQIGQGVPYTWTFVVQ